MKSNISTTRYVIQDKKLYSLMVHVRGFQADTLSAKYMKIWYKSTDHLRSTIKFQPSFLTKYTTWSMRSAYMGFYVLPRRKPILATVRTILTK